MVNLISHSKDYAASLPSPAIVAQEAVRRFPRWALSLLCGVYILSGFVGREPWKNDDIAGFSLLFNLLGTSSTAWFIARCTAVGLLCLILANTWYATYYLAKRDAAQPVPFAFGGEANPVDYARALADGALLALIACLGLARLAHETTPALLQTSLVSSVFFGLSAYRYHPVKSATALALALIGLWLIPQNNTIDFNHWHHFVAWRESIHLLIWFAWPAWALAGFSLIKWRRHWLCWHPAIHIGLPLGFLLLHLALLPCMEKPDRWFMSALPELAALAAFALPTLRRGMKSLIDLFTLIFFTGCAIIIWIVWIAMETGIPPQPAANVARLAPLFKPTHSFTILVLALVISAFWGWLVAWRLGKHRPAIWMSMVLPASGATLCWALLTSLWLPLLDHARSYKPLMLQIQNELQQHDSSCLQIHGLNPAEQAALSYYIKKPLILANRGLDCQWLIADSSAVANLPEYVTLSAWKLQTQLRRPTDSVETWLIYSRRQ
jgi:hypothetical protein